MNKIKISIAFDANIIGYVEADPRESDTLRIKTLKSTSKDLLESLQDLLPSTQDLKLVISKAAFNEISRGNEENAKNRIEIVKDMRVLEDAQEIEDLANLFIDEGVFRPRAKNDALILAAAAFYGIDYLVTWNMRDLANERNKRDMKRIILQQGYKVPILCTPPQFSNNYLTSIKYELSEHQVQDKTSDYREVVYNIDTMNNMYDMDTMDEEERQRWIDAIESSDVMIECRRIRAEINEEWHKDPEKYREKSAALTKKYKAQGIKFEPVPPTPPWIKTLLKMHKEKLAARETAKKKSQEK